MSKTLVNWCCLPALRRWEKRSSFCGIARPLAADDIVGDFKRWQPHPPVCPLLY
ncbi:hypothetical protein BRADI_3g06066v3 [Brachypodium distachyon]|uniref:Uncharacterized protein n=1 Tax=Brachypodium distachyon TaxID=15368 RepID=A0A2K2CVH9_BRADI|nr:hypothetical protein BRADI_3g06066v3 [Brachypodium distachyon]